ncbi:MAG TPA: recombinase family protein [Planctomycetota bacterium]|nr:recombinase family protein [Planctomycetota bacterium]
MTRAALYARVSTADQNADIQLARLRDFAAARGWTAEEFVDRGISGSRSSRPALDAMMARVRRREFSVVAVVRLDRLGRSLRHLLGIIEELERLKVDLVATDQPIDTSSPTGKLLFSVVGAVAEFERSLIAERVSAGMRLARQNGVRIGRPPVPLPGAEVLRSRLEEGASLRALAKEYRVSIPTLRRAMNASFPA